MHDGLVHWASIDCWQGHLLVGEHHNLNHGWCSSRSITLPQLLSMHTHPLPPEAWTPQVLQLQNSLQCLYQQLLPPTSSCEFARQGFYRPQFPIDRNHLQKQQSRHYFLWMNNQDDVCLEMVNNLFPHPTLVTCCLRGGHICSGWGRRKFPLLSNHKTVLQTVTKAEST